VNKPEDIEAVRETSRSGGARSTASSTPSPSPPKTPSAATS
jgi:hypothetical protein